MEKDYTPRTTRKMPMTNMTEFLNSRVPGRNK